ncbi:MAG TPA: hypothetical protein DEB31_06200 [Clostridiales bacterium]|nr:hypothetical protein [Clostridiales bacterium]
MKEKKVTIKDVAQESGVAVSTVSHVLNGTAKISDATKNRVLEVIRAMNYIPSNRKARGGGASSKVIGMMLADMTNEFYSRCTNAVMNAAAAENYSVLIGEIAYDYKREYMCVEAMIEKGVEGIIFTGGAMDANIIRRANKSIPVVLCDRKLMGTPFPTVTTDNVTIMRDLVALLSTWGYTKLGYVSESLELHNLKERFLGFKIGVEENGLRLQDQHTLILPKHRTDKVTTANQCLKEYMEKHTAKDLPEVFVTTSDLIAIGVSSALKENGLRIPEDIGITGFDDISVAAHLDPPLTTVAQNMNELGLYSFRNVLNLIHGTAIGIPHSVVDAKIITRGSVLGNRLPLYGVEETN